MTIPKRHRVEKLGLLVDDKHGRSCHVQLSGWKSDVAALRVMLEGAGLSVRYDRPLEQTSLSFLNTEGSR